MDRIERSKKRQAIYSQNETLKLNHPLLFDLLANYKLYGNFWKILESFWEQPSIN